MTEIIIMKSKFWGYTIFLLFVSFLFAACNPAEDKKEITHTITTNKKSISIYSDSIPKSKAIGKLKPGDEVFHPEYTSNGMAGVSLYKYGPTKGYIKKEYISSDTTIITLTSVLRNEYDQKIIPDLDEKFDKIADWYLDFFPIEEGGFWTYAIILAIGIAIFYGLSDNSLNLSLQLISLVLYSPFVIWVALNIYKYGLIHVDGFLLRLVIMLGFLATAILMVTTITASFGKLIGHNFTFKFSVWIVISLFLIYLGVAYFHSCCDFFFKFSVFIYGIFFLYFFIDQIVNMIRYAGFNLKSICRLLLNLILFGMSVMLISIIMIPVQITSAIIITNLIGGLFALMIPILFVGGALNSSGNYSGSASSWGNNNSNSDGSKYEHEISGGLTRGSGFDNHWYDQDGRKYEETSPGRYREVD